jgi:hypothetical protein
VGLITESLKRRFDEAFGVTLREGGATNCERHRSQVPIAPSEPEAEPTTQTAPADRPAGELEPGRLSKSFGPVSRCF